ncbi:MAG: transcription antitermination factor NusB [Pseudomonadota bacterium]
MGDRRLARELALQALFYFDMEKGDPHEMMSQFRENLAEDTKESVSGFFNELVQGVADHAAEIDGLLNTYSRNWRLTRMPVVDRNIMRIAVFELKYCPDIPASVTINEAVEIGKKYGTRDSGAFINGVLDRVRLAEPLE